MNRIMDRIIALVITSLVIAGCTSVEERNVIVEEFAKSHFGESASVTCKHRGFHSLCVMSGKKSDRPLNVICSDHCSVKD